MKLTHEEKETIITTNEAEEYWNIYTASLPIIRKLDKIAKAVEVSEDNNSVYAKYYKLPMNSVRFYKPKKLV